MLIPTLIFLFGCAIATASPDSTQEAIRLAQENRLELQTLTARIRELEQQVQVLSEKLATTPPTPPGLSKPAVNGGVASSRAKISPAEAALYKQASNLYYDRKYREALPVYQELASRYPQGGWADHAEYWIGECHFALGQFSDAIIAFRRVLEFKESEKAEDARFKLGYSLLRAGNRALAKEEFRRFVSLHPDSENLEKAKSELAALESSGL